MKGVVYRMSGNDNMFLINNKCFMHANEVRRKVVFNTRSLTKDEFELAINYERGKQHLSTIFSENDGAWNIKIDDTRFLRLLADIK